MGQNQGLELLPSTHFNILWYLADYDYFDPKRSAFLNKLPDVIVLVCRVWQIVLRLVEQK